MKESQLKIGDILDLKIIRAENSTFIVGEIVGIRQDYYNPDQIAVLIAGIDPWMVIGDNMEWSVLID
jgi:hypothetical protein